jgi:16S rRNA processing protein RimM
MTDARYLVVGRLRKPHGLKGDVTVFPLTDDPASVYAPGASLRLMDLAGDLVGPPLVIERSRSYHREWLLKFRDVDDRDGLEPLRDHMLAAESAKLAPPANDEVYLHELEGFSVRQEDGTALGLVSAVYEMPVGLMLEVQGPRREFLLPYKKEFVKQVDKANRRLVVTLPDGLLDL